MVKYMDMEKIEKKSLKYNVHHVLAHSYVVYFILFLFGLFLYLIFPIKIFENIAVSYIGFVFLFFATLLIFWAQKTSRSLDNSNLSKESFCKGPYCYTRTPTHHGLFLLMFGFSLTINSLFVVLSTIISFIISKLTFVKKQEDILLRKYGTAYAEYKKLVRF